MKNFRSIGISLILLGCSLFSNESFAGTKKFVMNTFEIQGSKIWLPSTIVVNKGDDVEILATVKIPGKNVIHGFTIEEFKIIESTDENGKTIKFKADKAGVFTIRCHLHPAHIGAQLLVL